MWFYGALLRSFRARTKFCQEFTDVFFLFSVYVGTTKELLRSFRARTKFCQEFTDVFFLFSVHFILRATLIIAERLASVTADTSFKVFGLTRLRIEPSLPASKANYCSKVSDKVT